MVNCLVFVGVFMISALVAEFAYRWRANTLNFKREKMLSNISSVALVIAVFAVVGFVASLAPLL